MHKSRRLRSLPTASLPWRAIFASASIALLMVVVAACGGGEPAAPAPAASGNSGGGAAAPEPTAMAAEPTAAMAPETQLETQGESFEFQMTCINRTVAPCELLTNFFIPAVAERTNGQVQMTVSSYPELGIAGPDTLRLVGDNTLELSIIYSGYVGGDLPLLDIGNLWGLSPSEEAHLALADAIDEDLIAVIKETTGGQPILRQYYPNQFIFSRDPLRTVADFEGKKIRQHSTILGDLLAGLGAEGQFLAFAEVYTALERGVMDAGVTAGEAGHSQRWYEVTDYLTGPIVGSVAVAYLVMSGDRWDSLPPDIQQIMLEVGKEYDALARQTLIEEWNPFSINANVEVGMTHEPFSDEVQGRMREVALNTILPNWVERTGGPNSDAVNLYNEKVAPIVGVSINPDGTASEIEAMMPAMSGGIDCGSDRSVGEVCISIVDSSTGEKEAMASTQCDGETAASVPDSHGGGSPSGWSCGVESDINFNLTPLTSSGESFEFQMACINRTLVDCGLAIGNYAETEDIGFVERVRRRTNGQVNFEISSFPELGIAGPDSLRLIEDGTLDSAQIYSGYVGGDFPIMDMSNLWGLFATQQDQLDVIDAIQPKMAEVTLENGGVQIAYMMTAHNYIFAKPQVDGLEDLQGLKVRSHSTVLSDLLSGMGADPQFIAFADVYTALERGVIDGAISCGSCGHGLRWYEVSDYLVGPIVSVGHSWFAVNADRWNQMPKDLQNIVLEEGARHAYLNRQLLFEHFAPNAIAQNVEQGMQEVEFTPEMKAAQRQSAIENVVPGWVDRVGGPTSEAAVIFNDVVAPIVKVEINADGTASATE